MFRTLASSDGVDYLDLITLVDFDTLEARPRNDLGVDGHRHPALLKLKLLQQGAHTERLLSLVYLAVEFEFHCYYSRRIGDLHGGT